MKFQRRWRYLGPSHAVVNEMTPRNWIENLEADTTQYDSVAS